MPWQVSCPHCHSVLNVTEKAVGQALPCPACKKLLTVPQAPAPAPGSSAVGGAGPFSGAPQYTGAGVAPPPPPPGPLPGMPPLPEPDGESVATGDAFTHKGKTTVIEGVASPSRHAAAPGRTSSGGAARPKGIVLIAFYWVIEGVLAIAAGIVVSNIVGGFGAFHQILSRAGVTEVFVAMALLDALGVFLFFYGLALCVASYGLWTFQEWGVTLATGVAVTSTALNLVALLAAMIMRFGIVSAFGGFLASCTILFYLLGVIDVRRGLERYE